MQAGDVYHFRRDESIVTSFSRMGPMNSMSKRYEYVDIDVQDTITVLSVEEDGENCFNVYYFHDNQVKRSLAILTSDGIYESSFTTYCKSY